MRVLFAAVVLLLSLSYGSLKSLESSSGFGIFGGSNVTIEEVPFMAIVDDRELGFFCGGAIIEKQYVLTAAHCCLRSNVSDVRVGTDQRKEGGQTMKVAEIHINPKFNYDTGDGDICVLKLENKLNFSDTVKPIPMANEDLELNEGDFLDTIGFGLTDHDALPDHLLKVSLQYVPNKKCSDKTYQAGHPKIIDSMLCAIGEEGKGPCNGDSGSPIFHKNTLVGLTSFGCGLTCADGAPTVFARISALRAFVDSVIAQDV